jgi:Cu-Zn family superoxide dismutase
MKIVSVVIRAIAGILSARFEIGGNFLWLPGRERGRGMAQHGTPAATFGAAGGIRWLALGVLAATAACSSQTKPARMVPSAANTVLVDAQSRRLGTAAVVPSKAGGLLVLKLTGVPPGEHGLHLHATGACDPPSFASAGPHYNPANRKHGAKNPQGPHAGDLPNVVARPDSSIDTTLAIPGEAVGAIGSGRAAKALVLHAQRDDLTTDPSGNSGDRIACGVLER